MLRIIAMASCARSCERGLDNTPGCNDRCLDAVRRSDVLDEITHRDLKTKRNVRWQRADQCGQREHAVAREATRLGGDANLVGLAEIGASGCVTDLGEPKPRWWKFSDVVGTSA